jgi:hypothetical protein
VQRITGGEIDAFIASLCFKHQSCPGACRNALLVLCQEALCSPTKSGKLQGGSCTHVLCVFPY